MTDDDGDDDQEEQEMDETDLEESIEWKAVIGATGTRGNTSEFMFEILSRCALVPPSPF